jgi:hypothetical protein
VDNILSLDLLQAQHELAYRFGSPKIELIQVTNRYGGMLFDSVQKVIYMNEQLFQEVVAKTLPGYNPDLITTLFGISVRRSLGE